jgi:hypothetical protein
MGVVNSDGALANHEEQPPHSMAYSGTDHGMAQSGRAPAWGVGGRRFESDHPDQKNKRVVNTSTETSVNNSFALNSRVNLNEVLVLSSKIK